MLVVYLQVLNQFCNLAVFRGQFSNAPGMPFHLLIFTFRWTLTENLHNCCGMTRNKITYQQ